MVSIQRVLSETLELPWLWQTCRLRDCIQSYIQPSTKACISFNTVFQITGANAVVEMLACCNKVTSSILTQKIYIEKNIRTVKIFFLYYYMVQIICGYRDL